MNSIDDAVMQAVQRLEIRARHRVEALFGGAYRSAFKGRGLEFAEVRPYQRGDDVRAIDWNVSARMDDTYVKVFEEEREQTVIVAVDVSASQAFGTGAATKRIVATEAAALVAFSALHHQDAVGLLLFTDRIEVQRPPRNTRRHVLHSLRTLLGHTPQSRGTDLRVPLRYLLARMRRPATVLLVSDFMDDGYASLLRAVGRRHDLVGMHVHDPGEAELPRGGLIPLTDAETGTTRLVDARDAATRRAVAQAAQERHARIANTLRQAQAGYLPLSTAGDTAEALISFFQRRIHARS
ncbi:DUF58 domain-containing protein [Longimonas halophila]|uniref:DUF58 domain-containing protein n=1 Tax=Longimonas halophila TaxID=1469170 RepID=A0A2H3NNJ8_9BACT|nr:DUF58 domain-containing protein [Longimonas halophila]PEN08466.1 DUF58 domain-containing protein [Longimonas halophila]